MAVETASDRAIFFSIQDFGIAASYTETGQNAKTVNGIFDDGTLKVDVGASVDVIFPNPTFQCSTDDVPNADRGETITVSGVQYTITDVMKDGTGLTILSLEK